MYINFFSLRRFVARFNVIATFTKIVATGAIILIGAYYLIVKGQTQHFAQPFKNSTIDPTHMVSALFAGLFAYDGWDILNFGTEEIERPRRTLPLAIIIGMTIVCTIYVAINVAYFTVLDIPTFLSTDAVANVNLR